MAKKRETRRQQKMQKLLKKTYGKNIWFFKVHGGPFQKDGIPDLVGCCYGMFFAFEVKEPDGEESEVQLETIRDIEKAGGLVDLVIEPHEVIDALEHALARAEKRGLIRPRT